MPKFRKKPVEIEAVQWDGSKFALAQIEQLNSKGTRGIVVGDPYDYADPTLIIIASEGDMFAKLNDWVIRGISGEIYPCKSDIFKKTYDPV